MNPNNEKYWINAQTDAQNKFGQEQEKIKDLNLDLWKSIIVIQATILGISISLLGYLKTNANLFLISTWVLEIISIAFGLLLFKIHINQEFKGSFEGYKFLMDMYEINILDARDGFNGQEEKRQGMRIAALIERFHENQIWNDYAKILAEKYKGELLSAKMFKKIKKTKTQELGEKLLKHQMKFVNVFYGLTAVSFLSLLLSILVK